jgi:hypothetical protein
MDLILQSTSEIDIDYICGATSRLSLRPLGLVLGNAPRTWNRIPSGETWIYGCDDDLNEVALAFGFTPQTLRVW